MIKYSKTDFFPFNFLNVIAAISSNTLTSISSSTSLKSSRSY
jgi:hypothetical protein